MNLYLVQHADAIQEGEDAHRVLTEQGWADIRKVADYAAAHLDIKVDRMVHSGKTRARQTAEALVPSVGLPRGLESTDGLDPMADPSVWERRLSEARDDVLLVGHMPHVGKLASLLLTRDESASVVTFERGGILYLRKGDRGAWSVRWMLVPSIL